jgi:hypothetical protein
VVSNPGARDRSIRLGGAQPGCRAPQKAGDPGQRATQGPGIGISTVAYLQCVCFGDGDMQTDCFGQSISPGAMQVASAPTLLGTLIKYKQLELVGATAAGDVAGFMSNVVSAASSVLGNVQKAAIAVVSLLGADGQPTGRTLQTYSPFVVPEGTLRSQLRAAEATLSQHLPAQRRARQLLVQRGRELQRARL